MKQLTSNHQDNTLDVPAWDQQWGELTAIHGRVQNELELLNDEVMSMSRSRTLDEAQNKALQIERLLKKLQFLGVMLQWTSPRATEFNLSLSKKP